MPAQSAAPLQRPAAHSGRAAASLLPLLLLFGALKMLAQVAITLLSLRAGYGIYRDELYYIVCSRHLALGYVDQPPLVALQAWLSNALFGPHHLIGFRLLPALAGALTVMLTGVLAQELGGSRRAAALAMLATLTAPVFLATQSFLSMNAWSPVLWMLAVWALLRLVAAPGGTRWWLLLGGAIGLGIENKVDTVFLAVAMLAAILAVPNARRLLVRRGFWLAVGTILLLAAPNVWWQAAHGWPTWEWLHAVAHSTKDVVLSPPRFLLAQALMLSPLQALVWGPGLVWLVLAERARPWRVAGALFLLFLALMMVLHAKDYYVAPIYPLLFAAGGVFWQQWAAHRAGRLRMVFAGCAAIAAFTVLTVPFAVPVLSPATYARYEQATHFAPIESERHAPTPLPEFFADQMGWEGLAADTERAWAALPAAQHAYTGIVADNYGQASAINVLTHGLPFAISGHQNYWIWGPHGETGQQMLVITARPMKDLLHEFARCTPAVADRSPWQMPWEQRTVYVCRDRRVPYQQDWPAMKLYW